VAGVSGVQGISGAGAVAFVNGDPGASPAAIHGGPASPVHGQALWPDPYQYPWTLQGGIPTSGAASVPPGLPAEAGVPPRLGAGTDPYAFANPEATGSHGAPWPKFGTADLAVNRDAAARQQEQNYLNHGVDAGDARRFQTAPDAASKMPWGFEAQLVTPGQAILQPVPAQLQGQMGRDRIQGTPPLNGYGFDSAHVTRPRAGGHVPGGFLWLRGAQRPMLVGRLGRNTFPVGRGSWFEGQTPGAGSVDAAVLAGLPAAYTPPPLPPTGDALGAAAAPPVWSSW
jgi:hypothetical protein